MVLSGVLAVGWWSPPGTPFGPGSSAAVDPVGTITTFRGDGIHDAQSIVTGPDGAVWFTEDIYGERPPSISRLDLDGTVTHFRSSLLWNPRGLTLGPDGALWITEDPARESGPGHLVRMTLEGEFTRFDVDHGVSGPGGLMAGPDGALWFTMGDAIGRITTAGVVSLFPVPALDPSVLVLGVPVAGPDGAVWFTTGYDGRIGRVTSDGIMSFVAVPPDPGTIAVANQLTRGADGALWFLGWTRIGRLTSVADLTMFDVLPAAVPPAEPGQLTGLLAGTGGELWFTTRSRVGRLSMAGSVTLDVATPEVGPRAVAADGSLVFMTRGDLGVGRVTVGGDVTVRDDRRLWPVHDLMSGPDGAVWIAHRGGVARVDPASLDIRIFTGAGGEGITSIASGPDGSVWFTAHNSIGRRRPDGHFQSYTGPETGLSPSSLAVAADGSVWFTRSPVGLDPFNSNRLGRISPTGELSTVALGFGLFDQAQGIIAGPDGALWFTMGSRIGRITTAGELTSFGGEGLLAPSNLTAGGDGAIWFVDRCVNCSRIGRVTMDGVVTTFELPPSTFPVAFAAGADGALWFHSSWSVGRIGFDGTVAAFDMPPELANRSVQGITVGGDGALWFTLSDAVGRATADGTFSTYPLGVDATGLGRSIRNDSVTTGADGNVWILLGNDGPLARVQVGAARPGSTAVTTTTAVAASPAVAVAATPDLAG